MELDVNIACKNFKLCIVQSNFDYRISLCQGKNDSTYNKTLGQEDLSMVPYKAQIKKNIWITTLTHRVFVIFGCATSPTQRALLTFLTLQLAFIVFILHKLYEGRNAKLDVVQNYVCSKSIVLHIWFTCFSQ